MVKLLSSFLAVFLIWYGAAGIGQAHARSINLPRQESASLAEDYEKSRATVRVLRQSETRKVFLSGKPLERAKQLRSMSPSLRLRVGTILQERNRTVRSNIPGQLSGMSFGCFDPEEGAISCAPGPTSDLWVFIDEYLVDFGSESGAEEVFVSATIEVHPPVEVNGQRLPRETGCSVAIDGAWGSASASCDSVQEVLNDPDTASHFASGWGEAARWITDKLSGLADTASPLLPKCSPTPANNYIQTPQTDREFGYLAAKSAIFRAYETDIEVLRPLMRADVRYPSGDVIRYIILWTSDLNTPSLRDMEITRFLDGLPTPGTSPC